ITVRHEDGRYRIGGFAPMALNRCINAPGYHIQSSGFVERGAGVHHHDLELFATRSLEVRVLDADGDPLQVTMRLSDGSGREIWVPIGHLGSHGSPQTDAHGEALLQNLPATTITVGV